MDIATLLSQYAFPIVACVAMGWYIKYITDQHRTDILQLNQEHKEAEERITEAINNNTLVMTRLCERMGEMDGDKDNG